MSPRTEQAFWVTGPGAGELRPVSVPDPGPDEVRVRTLFSGVSRGTESTVFQGRVPPSVRAEMRAPFQEGDLPGPVKYGYLNVGTVEAGAADLVGRTVFCLYPHQTGYVVPATAVLPVPEEVPPRRAVLAGALETAVNALWDVPPRVGDRVAVVGGGMVGLCVARLLVGHPGLEVTVVDPLPARREAATRLGAQAVGPDETPDGLDRVVHTSATEAGLRLSLSALAPEGTVVDLSWYGDREVSLPLGEAFHPRRLTLRSSQVGTVAPAQAGRRSTRDRLALALRLLADPAYDVLLDGETDLADLPALMPRLAAGEVPSICHVVRYPGQHA